jgi:hypothetical protein
MTTNKSREPHKTALITGASAGIGQELAQVFAAHGFDLVLVARRQDRLEALAHSLRSAHGIEVTIIAIDLAEPEAPQSVVQTVQRKGLTVKVLINNAGVNFHGDFKDIALKNHLELLQLNIVALTTLTHLCVQTMVKRGRWPHLECRLAGSLPAGTEPGGVCRLQGLCAFLHRGTCRGIARHGSFGDRALSWLYRHCNVEHRFGDDGSTDSGAKLPGRGVSSGGPGSLSSLPERRSSPRLWTHQPTGCTLDAVPTPLASAHADRTVGQDEAVSRASPLP